MTGLSERPEKQKENTTNPYINIYRQLMLSTYTIDTYIIDT